MIEETKEWRSSSFSGSGADSQCVQLVGSLDALRDSKNPDVEMPLGKGVGALIRVVKKGRIATPVS